MKKKFLAFCEDDSLFVGVFHNLGSLYHCKNKVNNAETNYKRGLSFKKSSGLLTEYSLFLYQYKRYQEVISYTKEAISKKNDGTGLMFGNLEKNIVGPELKTVIETLGGSIQITPYILAYRLLIGAYIEIRELENAKKMLLEFNQCVQDSNDKVTMMLLSYAKENCRSIEEGKKMSTNKLEHNRVLCFSSFEEKEFFHSCNEDNNNIIITRNNEDNNTSNNKTEEGEENSEEEETSEEDTSEGDDTSEEEKILGVRV